MAVWALCLYLLYGLLGSAQVSAILYPFDPAPFVEEGFAARQVARADEAEALTLYMAEAAPDAPVLLYFMGNAGSLRHFAPMLRHHVAAGRSVVAMAYRGGGGAPGTPSEAGLKRDALLARDAVDRLLPEAGAVALQGYSLGSGLALHVAARREVDAVVLTAPYGRLCRLMAQRSRLPVCAMWWVDRWRSDRDVPVVTAPVLILHGDADTLIPLAEGGRLAETFRQSSSAPVTFRVVRSAGHTDLTAAPEVRAVIDGFLETYAP